MHIHIYICIFENMYLSHYNYTKCTKFNISQSFAFYNLLAVHTSLTLFHITILHAKIKLESLCQSAVCTSWFPMIALFRRRLRAVCLVERRKHVIILNFFFTFCTSCNSQLMIITILIPRGKNSNLLNFAKEVCDCLRTATINGLG